MSTTDTLQASPRLTSLSHGGGCGCKIAPGVLSGLLKNMPVAQAVPQLLVGHESSDDAAVYQLNDQQALVATTDFFMPIVDDPYDFGRIAATNALSDIYAMGGTPIMALALVGMPINVLDHADIARILEGGASVCAEAGAPVAGGHSIDSVEPIYGLAALGLVHPDHIRKNSEARAGDQLILGKALGVGVLSAALKKDGLAPEQYQAMLHSTTQLNRSGPALAALVGVHAMTDVTGFGLLGHTLELARESGLAAHVQASSLPWLPDVPALARQGLITGASARNWAAYGEAIRLGPSIEDMTRALLCDPQTSGGLLVSCRPDAVDAVLEQFHQDGLTQATVIGEMQPLDSEGDHVVVA